MRYSPRSSYPLKRFERLRKCESRLIDRISATADDREVLQAAERVREAQLLVFKGLRHDAMEIGDNKKLDLKRLAKIDAEMAEWEGKSVEEIVGMYRGKQPQERKTERNP